MKAILTAFLLAVLAQAGAQAQTIESVGAAASDYIARLRQLAPGLSLSLPANAPGFLSEVQRMATASTARDLTSLGLQAAKLSLQIEEIKINFLQNNMCNGAPAITVPPQYSQHLETGCQLLAAHHKLNGVQQKALGLIPQP